MNEDSLTSTLPEAEIIGTGVLAGFRRVFNVKSPYRKNEVTGVYSSVLNIEPAPESLCHGTIIDLGGDEHIEDLFKREEGYDFFEVLLEDQTKALACIAEVDAPYSYVFNDYVQKEYLDICVTAAKKLNFLEEFSKTTFIGNKTIAELDLV